LAYDVFPGGSPDKCRSETIEASDHIIYIAEVVEAHTDPEERHLYSMNGYSSLDTVKE